MPLKSTFQTRKELRKGAVLAVCVMLAGCAALPEPDGLEAQLNERAAGLKPMTQGTSDGLNDIARTGLLVNPSVREFASLVAASADEVRVQRAALFPSLSLSAGGGIGEAGDGDPSLELTGSQLLYDGGISRRAVKVADVNLQISYVAFQQSVDEALLELLTTYDRVQMQRELLDVYRRQLNALHELERLVAARTNSGAVAATDLLETRKRVQAAEFLVHDTELALAEARDRLVLLGGGAQGGRLSITAPSCRATVETDDLRLAQLELARAELSYEQARKALNPSISLLPVVRGELGADRLPVGLNLDIQSDLLQGGALTAKANAARNSLLAASADLESVRLEDSLTERGLLRSLSAGQSRAALLRNQIALLAETRELYRSQYFSMGTRQLSELLDNEEEYYGRQAEQAELRSDLAISRVQCATRNRALRGMLGLHENSLYGFPMEPRLN